MGSGAGGIYGGTWGSPEGNAAFGALSGLAGVAASALVGESAAALVGALAQVAVGSDPADVEWPGAGEVAADLALDAASLLFPEGKAVSVALALAGSARAVRAVRAADAAYGYAEAIARAAQRFPVTVAGNFGRKGKGHNVREIVAADVDAASRELFDLLRRDGRLKDAGSLVGKVAELEDGTILVHRLESKSGGPVIEIHYPKESGKVRQKIHFVKEGGDD